MELEWTIAFTHAVALSQTQCLPVPHTTVSSIDARQMCRLAEGEGIEHLQLKCRRASAC